MFTAGYPASELRKAGFTVQEIIETGRVAFIQEGCTLAEMLEAGLNPAYLCQNGIPAEALREAGADPRKFQQAGITLGPVGYTAQELKDRGFTAAELLLEQVSYASLVEVYSYDELVELNNQTINALLAAKLKEKFLTAEPPSEFKQQSEG
jgi:hypothetical protein